jgi:hypothetical protein
MTDLLFEEVDISLLDDSELEGVIGGRVKVVLTIACHA